MSLHPVSATVEVRVAVTVKLTVFLAAFLKIAKGDYWLRHVCQSVIPHGRIFMKFGVRIEEI
jgi:hypothetical protein